MRHQRRPLSLLLIGILSLLTLASLIYYFPPTSNLTFPQMIANVPIAFNRFIQVPPLIIFFLLLAIFLFSIGAYVTKSKAHGVLIAGLIISYLVFRLYHLTHPFFLILLLALFFSLEMFVANRKE